jgi:hypothetical protein
MRPRPGHGHGAGIALNTLKRVECVADASNRFNAECVLRVGKPGWRTDGGVKAPAGQLPTRKTACCS